MAHRLAPEAEVELDNIWYYIAKESRSVEVADRVIADILASVGALVPFPNRGHRRPDLTSRPLRFTLARDHAL